MLNPTVETFLVFVKICLSMAFTDPEQNNCLLKVQLENIKCVETENNEDPQCSFVLDIHKIGDLPTIQVKETAKKPYEYEL